MDRKEMKAELQHVMDSAREQLKKAEAAFDEAKKSGKDLSDDVVRKVEEAHKEVSSTLSNWWDKIRTQLDKGKDIKPTK